VLEREIAAVRRQGYGLDVEEYAEDLCCLGVPVREAQGGAVVAALSIAMPKLRFRRALVAGWRQRLEDKAALIAPQAGLIGA
jgi:DNA-binding IclR family transcriptional regulator